MLRFIKGVRDVILIFGVLWVTILGSYTLFSTTVPSQATAQAARATLK